MKNTILTYLRKRKNVTNVENAKVKPPSRTATNAAEVKPREISKKKTIKDYFKPKGGKESTASSAVKKVVREEMKLEIQEEEEKEEVIFFKNVLGPEDKVKDFARMLAMYHEFPNGDDVNDTEPCLIPPATPKQKKKFWKQIYNEYKITTPPTTPNKSKRISNSPLSLHLKLSASEKERELEALSSYYLLPSPDSNRKSVKRRFFQQVEDTDHEKKDFTKRTRF
jgi:hypothetical protein